MLKRRKVAVVSILILVVLLTSLGSLGFVFAQSSHSQTPQAQHPAAGKNTSIASSIAATIDMSQVPMEQAGASKQRAEALPLLTGVSPSVYAQHKAGAAHNSKAPKGTRAYSQPGGVRSDTPIASKSFQGMADSASICPYFGGCEPPDMALATSSKYELQGVNTSFAVYSSSGSLQSGWPKTAQNFFRVPNPGSCDLHGPFLSDPRAFYDPNSNRFWAATLQLEGAFGIPCSLASYYWIAYSLTSSPTGTWCSYAFPMSLDGVNVADYTQFGFDGQAVYFSGNMFNSSTGGYSYDEAFSFTKPTSTTSCASGFTAYGFYNLTTPDGVVADTVQPVLTEATPAEGPTAGLFISSYNINSGSGQCYSGCSNVVVWAMANPGTSSASLTRLIIGTGGYALPPSADQPGCTYCVETLDTRISGTPVYHNGLISFALETGVNNGSQVVPGIFWGQVMPFLDDTGALVNGYNIQNGYQYYGGDGAASFGAVMPDLNGDLFMVFEFMSSSTNPEVAYVSRRVNYYPGYFHDAGFVLRSGASYTFDTRWGDYEAASYDGSSADDVWFAGEYAASNHDWSTYIGKDKYSVGVN